MMNPLSLDVVSASRKRRHLLTLLVPILALTGCADIHMQRVASGEAPIVLGPPVRTNRTPMEAAFSCLGRRIKEERRAPLTIAVGDIRDYTGKYNINEGNAITQGGSLMVYSALGKLGGAVRIANRYNMDVSQMELAFLNQRVLGDGKQHILNEGATHKAVPWIPYYGGSVIASDYFISGGITELNYNIQSGGAEFELSQLGPKARVFTENIGVDLQIVNTRTLVVEKTVSLSKQIVGYEVGFNVFRFFGNDLYDVNIGNKSQEPLQLGVRSTLEDGVIRLISSVTHVHDEPCLALVDGRIPPASAAAKGTQPYGAATAPAAARPAVPVSDSAPTAQTLNAKTSDAPLQNGLMVKDDGTYRIVFDFGGTDLVGADVPEIERAAAAARQHPVQLLLLARANENWAPSKRAALSAERIASVRKALTLRGILKVSVGWMPDPVTTGIVMDGAGYQKIAVVVAKQ